MELTIYDAIQGAVVSEKANLLIKKLKKIVLKVHPHANKPMIKEALEKLFKIKVENVRIIVRQGKIHTFRRIKSQGALTKRAIVTLKEGYSLPEIEQVFSSHAEISQEVNKK